VKFNFLARLSTPVVPTMDNLFLDTFYFFVPYRLLWKHRAFRAAEIFRTLEARIWRNNAEVRTKNFSITSTAAGITFIKLLKLEGLTKRVNRGSSNRRKIGDSIINNTIITTKPLQKTRILERFSACTNFTKFTINLSSYVEISTASGLDDVGLGDAGFTGSHKLLRRANEEFQYNEYRRGHHVHKASEAGRPDEES
jgi:hypothetical protein